MKQRLVVCGALLAVVAAACTSQPTDRVADPQPEPLVTTQPPAETTTTVAPAEAATPAAAPPATSTTTAGGPAAPATTTTQAAGQAPSPTGTEEIDIDVDLSILDDLLAELDAGTGALDASLSQNEGDIEG